eukprot:tig00021742_g23309.t1
MAGAGITAAGGLIYPCLDFAKPQVVFFSGLWTVDVALRGAYMASGKAQLAFVATATVLIWTVFPPTGACESAADYFANLMIAGCVLPLSFLSVRETEVRRRSDFARVRSLRSELQWARVEGDGLREHNERLREQLAALQRTPLRFPPPAPSPPPHSRSERLAAVLLLLSSAS